MATRIKNLCILVLIVGIILVAADVLAYALPQRFISAFKPFRTAVLICTFLILVIFGIIDPIWGYFASRAKRKHLDKVKIGQKFRIKFKNNDKLYRADVKVFANNAKKKLLKFEVKGKVYECNYDDVIKIHSLGVIRIKRILKFILFFVLVLSVLIGYENQVEYKPIIYLYPEENTEVKVELGYPENTTYTYPKYDKPWQVMAEPNGNLTDLKTGRYYYALYWEGMNTVSSDNPNEGFVVKGENTINFLEEKLDQLGLTEREANEFIIYWLPKLEGSPYNFIRFQTLAEQNENMPLVIEPTPDTLIRVMMEYDNLDDPIEIKEQILPPKPERDGFTVVEWGGTKIDL